MHLVASAVEVVTEVLAEVIRLADSTSRSLLRVVVSARSSKACLAGKVKRVGDSADSKALVATAPQVSVADKVMGVRLAQVRAR